MAIMYSLDIVSPHTSGAARELKRSGKRAVFKATSWITYRYVPEVADKNEAYWIKGTHFKRGIYIRHGNKTIAFTHQHNIAEIVEGEGA